MERVDPKPYGGEIAETFLGLGGHVVANRDTGQLLGTHVHPPNTISVP